jgi:uncharacterized repeat protein (TIGR01451 family)
MKRRQIIIPFVTATLLIALVWTTLQAATLQTAALQAAQQSSVALTKNNDLNQTQQQTPIVGLTTTADSLSFILDTAAIQDGEAGKVDIAALNSRINQPGSPDLPYYTTFIALPPGASAELIVEPGETAAYQDWSITAVPDPQSAAAVEEDDPNFAAVNDSSLTTVPDPAVYQKNAEFPESLYELSEPMYIRDSRLVTLKLYPFQYNPVSRQLTQHRQLQVTVNFVGGEGVEERPLQGRSPFSEALDSLVLNAEQAQAWRGLPDNISGGGTMLPVGSDVYKIQVNQDGIHEVTYADLQAAGMNVNSVNPNTFQMLYRGQPVAYEFIGDGDNQFEAGEKVRFYGWAFNGPRLEKQFINDNVFWLWANGTPATVSSVASQNGFPVAPTFLSSITTEPEFVWHASWTDQWDTFPNEPDAWYWGQITKGSAAPITVTLPISLSNPAPGGPNAEITAEFTSKLSPVIGGNQINHEMTLKVNGHPNAGYGAWLGKKNVNVTTDIPMSSVISGSNSFELGMHTAAAVGGSQSVYLNRITVDYTRLFIATDDQLIFSDEVGGSREFNIDGYSENNTANIIVWDITDPTQPQKVTGVAATGGGPSYTYEFGTNHPAGASFIATTTGNALSPAQLSRYDVPDLEPPGNGADWVAIAYKDFITETQVLADHRENPLYGGFDAHVVDIEDVVNQYGYGLPIPAAVQDYLLHGLATWQLPPAYLLLVGDATIDPHEVTWNAPQYVMADLAFVDRYQGQIPSDHAFSLLVGTDILPDLAVGRIPAKTAADTAAVVDKIIIYDQNQVSPSAWMNNLVFLGDNTDEAGNFCLENQDVMAHIPDFFNKHLLCLPDNPTTNDADDLRAQLFNHTNVTGTLILNYRGHGSITTWASNPIILNPTHLNSWNNPTKPVASLTGDCLDGFFAHPAQEGLGETFLRAEDKGTVVHWSSSGLGLSSEHSVLVEGLYDAVFLEGLTALGDAANFAKIHFNMVGGHQSLLYSFVLEGDPAMHLMRPNLTIDKTAPDPDGEPGDTAEFILDISNLGLYPSHVVVTDTLPAELNYLSFQSTLSATASIIGSDVIFNLQFGNNLLNGGLPMNESAVITITTEVDSGAPSGTVTNSAVIGGPGLDTAPGDNSDSALYNIFVAPVLDFFNYLPTIHKK